MTDPLRTNESARAAVQSTKLLVLGILVVATVRLGVYVALGRRDVSAAVASPVAQVAVQSKALVRYMPECKCCRNDREAKGLRPRNLVTIELPKGNVRLCEHCDGEEVIDAITRNTEAPES